MNTRRVNSGFTIVELLIVIVIIGILATLVVSTFRGITEQSRLTKAQNEMQLLSKATEVYRLDNDNEYPEDVDRGLPPPIVDLVQSQNGKDWPDGPYPGSVYDYDVYEVSGVQAVQISLRFCPINGPLSACNFPNQEWAEGFGVNSSVFRCLSGPCKAHPNRAAKGYCVNCNIKTTYN